MLKTIKDFIIFMLKTNWFKIIASLLILLSLYCMYDLTQIHYDAVNDMFNKVANNQMSYEQAMYEKSALAEQIVFQLITWVVVVIIFIVAILVEQNSRLRTRVRDLDFKLWEIEKGINLLNLQLENRNLDDQRRELEAKLAELREKYAYLREEDYYDEDDVADEEEMEVDEPSKKE